MTLIDNLDIDQLRRIIQDVADGDGAYWIPEYGDDAIEPTTFALDVDAVVGDILELLRKGDSE